MGGQEKDDPVAKLEARAAQARAAAERARTRIVQTYQMVERSVKNAEDLSAKARTMRARVEATGAKRTLPTATGEVETSAT